MTTSEANRNDNAEYLTQPVQGVVRTAMEALSVDVHGVLTVMRSNEAVRQFKDGILDVEGACAAPLLSPSQPRPPARFACAGAGEPAASAVARRCVLGVHNGNFSPDRATVSLGGASRNTTGTARARPLTARTGYPHYGLHAAGWSEAGGGVFLLPLSARHGSFPPVHV